MSGWAATNTLRGTVADCQDVLSAPDVDRAMAALALVEAALDAADASLSADTLTPARCILATALRAVREKPGNDGAA